MWQKFLSWFRRKEIRVKSYEFQAPSTQRKYGNWRVGMWVVLDNEIGIIAQFFDSSVNFHKVNSKTGETVSEQIVPFEALRQARWEEIPECRRGFTREAAAELGYGD